MRTVALLGGVRTVCTVWMCENCVHTLQDCVHCEDVCELCAL